MKLLRTLRLDPSDAFVFERAAEPGEIAVVGSFAWWDADVAALEGKARAAFRAGFLGVESLGRSTLVEVVEVDEQVAAAALETLAGRLVAGFGAPDLDAARPAAKEELDFAASLAADPRPGAVLAMRRVAEGGAFREEFRVLARRGLDEAKLDPRHWRAFTFFESDEEPVEQVDLIGAAASAAEHPIGEGPSAAEAAAPVAERLRREGPPAAEAAAPVGRPR